MKPNDWPPGWLYDETSFKDIDYQERERAQAYDERHNAFRDFEAEARLVRRSLKLEKHHLLLDLGCGTGELALRLASACRQVMAVDLSPAMLEIARAKAASRGQENLVFRQAGLLTYTHQGPPADGILMCVVLHHLPDFFKLLALNRAAALLRPGGRLHLADVVFPSREPDPAAFLTASLSQAAPSDELISHIKNEYSTFDWIMEGLIERAGLTIESVGAEGFLTRYTCQKPAAG